MAGLAPPPHPRGAGLVERRNTALSGTEKECGAAAQTCQKCWRENRPPLGKPDAFHLQSPRLQSSPTKTLQFPQLTADASAG